MRACSGNCILISDARLILKNIVVHCCLVPAQNLWSAKGSPRLHQGDACLLPHPVVREVSAKRRCLQSGFVIHVCLAISKDWGCEEGGTAAMSLCKINCSLWLDLAYGQDVSEPWDWRHVSAKKCWAKPDKFRCRVLHGRCFCSTLPELCPSKKRSILPFVTVWCAQNFVVCKSGSVIFLSSDAVWPVLRLVVALGDNHNIRENCSMFRWWLHRRTEFQTNFVCGKSLLWWSRLCCK